ncbi:MAG: hypothetical protein ABL932_23205 [Terricaulis sp.]
MNVPGLSAFSRRAAQPVVQPTTQTLNDDAAEEPDADAAAEPQQ